MPLLEVPEHALRQSRYRGVGHTAQLHGEVVARQHHLIYLIIYLRLILLDPSQLGRGKVARRIEQMPQALSRTQVAESPLAVRHGT